MATTFIPASLDDITPEWLTDALRSGGAIRNARVVSFDAELLSEGVGFIGQVARIGPHYDVAEAGAPASIIAKMPTLDEGGRAIAALYGLYERELNFYRELAADVPVRTPRCYFSDGDAAAVRYILLLEDLSAFGHLGDQLRACTIDEATEAMITLARLHAWSWDHPRLAEIPWLDSGIDLVEGAMAQAYAASWPRTLELFGDQMSQAIRDALPTLEVKGVALLDRYRDGPFAIAHGDFRADNLFFGADGIAVLDWQSPIKSFAAYDVAYFLSGSIDEATLRAEAPRLLRAYHDELVAGGVWGYSFERFYEDYVGSLLAYLVIFIINGATLDTANERGAELFRVIYERLAAAITDTDALSLLA
jgi:aminoglycoside phosphotransferase family enzyme